MTTSLYNLRARYYDPTAGRFLSRDIWAYDFQNPLELNRYVYAMGNPVNWSDPTGYFSYGSATKTALKALTALRNLRSVTLLKYSGILSRFHQIIKFAPIFACAIMGFASDADVGPTCDLVPADELGEAVRGITYTVVGPNSGFAQAVQDIRRGIGQAFGHSTISNTQLGRNHAIIEVTMDGIGSRTVYAISGDNKDLDNAVKGYEVARGKPQILQPTDPEAGLDSEIKGLDYILRKIIEPSIDNGRTNFDIKIYTERKMCGSCFDVTNTFYDLVVKAGGNLSIGVEYSVLDTPELNSMWEAIGKNLGQ